MVGNERAIDRIDRLANLLERHTVEADGRAMAVKLDDEPERALGLREDIFDRATHEAPPPFSGSTRISQPTNSPLED